MANWIHTKLGNVADLQNGYAFKSKDFDNTGIPIIKIKNIIPPNVVLEKVVHYNGEISDYLSKYLVEYGDILISMTGSTVNQMSSAVGKIGRYKKNIPALLNQRVGKIKIIDNRIADIDYLYYFISRPEIHYLLALNATGSANQANISPDQIKDIEITLPPIDEQKRISELLSSLDYKIELNLEINKTMEELAMAIYKEWFVNFGPFKHGEFVDSELGPIPKGWLITTLGDKYEAVKGLSYKGKHLSLDVSEMPLHNLNSIYEGGYYKNEGIKYYDGEYKEKHIVKPGDLIVANTEQGHKYLLIGSPALIPANFGESGLFSHHLYRIDSKDNKEEYKKYLYYKLLDPNYRNIVTAYCNGTTVNMLQKEGFVFPKIVIPPSEILISFLSIVNSLHELKEKNIEENRILMDTRDYLLPKLINGEIRVKEVEDEVKKVI